jgi:1,4-dihydroxy-6-naphthoate synthase
MISIAHSPDSDDYFMFWALRTGLISGLDQEISYTPLCTEELNQRAREAEFDVTAASVGVLPYVCDRYDVLTHGASVGRGYGPRLVSQSADSLESLRGKVVGIPGSHTTAALVLAQILPDTRFVEIPIQPFDLVFDKLESRVIDAALLIHEGQFYFDKARYNQLIDLGQWWDEKYNLPLPLGVNLIRKSLDPTLKQQLSNVILHSIQYGLGHIEDALPYLQAVAKQNDGPPLDQTQLRHYLNSYANQDSLQIDEASKKAIQILVKHAKRKTTRTNSLSSIVFQH